MLQALGHSVALSHKAPNRLDRCQALIALHARKSHSAIKRFKTEHPHRPLIVALTGTDLYQDLPRQHPKAQESLELADRVVALQARGGKQLAPNIRRKLRVIYQSVPSPTLSINAPPVWRRYESRFQQLSPRRPFTICVVGHLRTVKDPLRAAWAARDLPESSNLHILHFGRALSPAWSKRAREEMRRNHRYHWLGEAPRVHVMQALLRSQALAITSHSEGGANVVMEAIACGLPILSSRMDGSIGILGEDYPGYFPTGDTKALCHLFLRLEQEAAFQATLRRWIRRLTPLTSPARERASWKRLLAEVMKA